MLFAMYGVTDHWELKIRSIKFAVNLRKKLHSYLTTTTIQLILFFLLRLYFHYDIQFTSPHWINRLVFECAPLVLLQTVVVVADIFFVVFFCFNSRLHHLNFVWVHLEVLLSSIAIKMNKMTACIMYRLQNEIECRKKQEADGGECEIAIAESNGMNCFRKFWFVFFFFFNHKMN